MMGQDEFVKPSIRQESGHETARIAAFITDVRYEDLPAEVVTNAKRHILDTLGAMVSGNRVDAGQLLVKFAQQQGAGGQSTIVGADFKTSSIMAATVNSALGHADETDDKGGTATVPVALTLGEQYKIDGKTVIKAVVLGYDIFDRIWSSLDIAELKRRKHGELGISTAFGAAVTASCLLGLDKEQVCSALGLTGQQVCSSAAIFFGPRHMARPFEVGTSVRNAVLAVFLARMGFQGTPDIIEGPCSILESVSGENYKRDQILKDLGMHYRIMDAAIKKYPVGAQMERPLEGLFQIMRKHTLAANDILEMTVATQGINFAKIVEDQSTQKINYRYVDRIEYVLSAAAHFGKFGWEEHTESKLKDPNVRELSKRVRFVCTAEKEKKRTATVDVVTKDGRQCSVTIESVPMTQKEIEYKFLDLAGIVLGREKSHKVIEMVNKLEKLSDITQLANLLCLQANA
jgi:2-methylcitrate dehydratase PrpD